MTDFFSKVHTPDSLPDIATSVQVRGVVPAHTLQGLIGSRDDDSSPVTLLVTVEIVTLVIEMVTLTCDYVGSRQRWWQFSRW